MPFFVSTASDAGGHWLDVVIGYFIRDSLLLAVRGFVTLSLNINFVMFSFNISTKQCFVFLTLS